MRFTKYDFYKFPSGRTVARVRKDAKKLKKARNIRMYEALNILARENGMNMNWNDALASLMKRSHSPNDVI